MSEPTDEELLRIALAVGVCAAGWSPEARIIGNVTAAEVLTLASSCAELVKRHQWCEALSRELDAARKERDKLRAEEAFWNLQGRALECADIVAYAKRKARALGMLSRSAEHQERREALYEFAQELEQKLHKPAAEPRCADGTLIVEANDAGKYEP